MLRNDPPPGTKIRFVRGLRDTKGYDTGTLDGKIGEHTKDDRPGDMFWVVYRGQPTIVRRDEIEEV